MEQVKHTTAAENSVKRYESPRAKVVFAKAQGVLCQSVNTINYLNLREDDSDNWR